METTCPVCGMEPDAVVEGTGRFCSARCEALAAWALPPPTLCDSSAEPHEPSPLDDVFPNGPASRHEVIKALCVAKRSESHGDPSRTSLATLLYEELRNQMYFSTDGALYVRHLTDVGEDVAVCGAPSLRPGALLLPRAEISLGSTLSHPPDDPSSCLEVCDGLSDEDSFIVTEFLPRAVLHSSQWAACAVPFLQSAPTDVSLATRCVMWRLMAKRSNVKPLGCGNDGAVFSTISFVSHSCSPNCAVVSVVDSDTSASNSDIKAQLIALRPIKRGELLTTSVRLTSVELRMPTGVRQEILQLSRGVTPCCTCTRCCAAVDYARGFACECGGIRYPEGNSHPETEKTIWRCSQCSEWWREQEMPIGEENKICEAVYRLWISLCRDEDGDVPPTLSKNTFAEIRDVTAKASGVLGDGHWTNLVLAEACIGFYRCFLKRFSALTSDEAQVMIAKWGLRWIQLALMQRFDEHCPIETGIQALRCAVSLTSPALFADKVRFLRFAHRHLEPLVSASSDSERLQFPLCKEAAGLWEVMRSSKIAKDWTEVSKWVNKDMEGANDLLDEWENYLVSRVSAARPQRSTGEGDAFVNPFLEKALRNGTR